MSPGGGERPSDLLSRCRGSSLGSVQVSPGGGEGPSDILSNYAMFPNKARCGYELLYLELRRLKYGEARGPRVHLSNKLFLGVSGEMCTGAKRRS